jgi:two-component system C4-dicarboxylate transport sensor histidine kinase DctB
VVEDIRLFARDSEQHHCTPGILQDGLQRVLRLLGTQLSRHGITLRQHIPPDFPPVLLSQMHLERVLSNLLTNARQALDTIDKPGKTITLTAHVDAPVAVLCVEDNGPGIPPACRSQLFDPFFTTKAPGEGTGLGLSIVHGLITDAGGDITVTEGQEGGAAFVVRMPIVEEG